MKFFTAMALVLFFSVSCSLKSTKSAMGSEAQKLQSIVQNYTDKAKRLDAYWATYFNVEEDLSKFGNYQDPEQREKSKLLIEQSLQSLTQVSRDQLGKFEKLTYDLFKSDLENNLRALAFPYERLDFNQMGNRFRQYLDDTSPGLSAFPFDSVKHYDDFVKRSEGFLPYVDRQIAVMNKGLQTGVVLNCTIAKNAVNTYKEGLEKNTEKHAFYRPVLNFPKDFSADDQKRIRSDFAKMIQERIIPGFEKFDQYYQKTYLPKCRKGFGLDSVPNGQAWYTHNIQSVTNLKLSADEVHKIGLTEVARLQGEMKKIQQKLGYKGSLADFYAAVRKNPKSYFKNRQEVLSAFENIRQKIDPKISQIFNLTPKSEYKITESENSEDAAASYSGPTELKPYGRFIVNTINLKANDIYSVTTLSMHEAIPGHHFQIALQYEMQDKLSEYQRKIYGSTAFVEGWALYAEYLGRELGLYEDPTQMFGHLSAEMLRAVRLVVDTGMHAKGWSREKCIQYMASNTPEDLRGVATEIDRYSVWPAQALGYKIGQLKILELRRKAEKELGSKFDLKGFHAAVIGSGSISLPVLENQVDDWILNRSKTAM